MHVLKNTCAVIAASAALLAAPTAFAEGWYIGAGIGDSIAHDGDVSGAVNENIDHDNGFAGIGALGYRFTDNIRSELELGFRSNDVDGTNASSAAGGDADVTNVMLNVLYDFRDESLGAFSPYLGAGLGVVDVDYDNVTPLGATTLNDSGREVGYQFIAGVSYAINNMLDAFVDYRYLRTEPDFNTGAGSVDIDYDNSTVLLGVRYNFGTPSPQPVRQTAAPVPVRQAVNTRVAERQFIVFFDLNSADLTADAKAVLGKAAKALKKGNVTSIKVTGHTDTTGTSTYNDWLSKRRSAAVKAELARLGVKQSQISTYAKGENQLLISTKDGVLEPQNRRAEIGFSEKVK